MPPVSCATGQNFTLVSPYQEPAQARCASGDGKPESPALFIIIYAPVFAGRISRIFLTGFQKIKIIIEARLYGDVIDGH